MRKNAKLIAHWFEFLLNSTNIRWNYFRDVVFFLFLNIFPVVFLSSPSSFPQYRCTEGHQVRFLVFLDFSLALRMMRKKITDPKGFESMSKGLDPIELERIF